MKVNNLSFAFECINKYNKMHFALSHNSKYCATHVILKKKKLKTKPKYGRPQAHHKYINSTYTITYIKMYI